jgi:hypothetical protein
MMAVAMTMTGERRQRDKAAEQQNRLYTQGTSFDE